MEHWGAPAHPILVLLRTPIRLLSLLKSARTSLHLMTMLNSIQLNTTEVHRFTFITKVISHRILHSSSSQLGQHNTTQR
jgi:hypothetical protein